jgi:hypothetical protein
MIRADYPHAITYFELLLKADPKRKGTHYSLAIAYRRCRQY